MFAKIENNTITATATEDEVRRKAQDAGVFLARDFDEWGDWMRVLDEGAQPPDFHDTSIAIELVEGVPTVVYSYTLNADAQEVAIQTALKAERDKLSTTFVFRGVPMSLHDGARADLIALYFTAVMDAGIVDDVAMAHWQEPGHDTLVLTAGDLRAHGRNFMAVRQAGFTAYDLTKGGAHESVDDALLAIHAAFSGIVGGA